MFISKIRIRNFRNFADFEIDELRPGAVFVGENGVGKSNLLHALRLVLDPSLPDSARVLRAEDFWSGLTPFDGAVIEVEVELEGWDGDPTASALLTDCVVGTDPLAARITYRYRPRSGVETGEAEEVARSGASTYEWLIFGGTSESDALGSWFRRALSIRVLHALRDAESDLESWRRSPLAELLARLDLPYSKLESVAEDVAAASESLLREPQLAALNDDITAQVEQMVGEVFASATELKMVSAQPDQVLRSVRLMVSDRGERDVADVSLGTANVLYLALLLQSVLAQRADNLLTVLAVEEPEAHLHPHLQRVLFRYLLGMDVPLVLTTHSAHIVSVSDLPSVVLLRDTHQQTLGYSIAGAGLSEAEVADLDRYLDVTRSELLFAKGVILVEGAAELYLLPAFAECMGLSFDELGITVASVQGTDFSPFRRLLGKRGFDIPNVVVTDGDQDPTTKSSRTNAGIRRGIALVRGTQAAKETAKFLLEGELEAARRRLRRRRVFVGEHTLEVDVAASPGGAEAMSKAYKELASGFQARKFETDIADIGDAAGRARLLRRISAIGKGRYAQRLAEHCDGVTPPEYIARAIDAIHKAVTDAE